MGESLVLIRNDAEKKEMGDPTRFALETSVSFGRFESDSLSWEKWSSFSPNRYLEEVEKCATPGSVASKKAFFESRYKNVPPKKDPHDEHDATRSDQTSAVNPSFVAVEEPVLVEVVTTVEETLVESNEADKGMHQTLFVEVGETMISQSKSKVQDRVASSRKSIAAVKKTLVKEKAKANTKQKDSKSFPTIGSKQVSPQKISKKELRSTELTPRGSSRKTNSISIERKKVTADNVVPLSSISFGSRSENRKPLIMETMKDKDIVKRAFKSFQKPLSETRNSTTVRRPSLVTQKVDAPKKSREISVPKVASKIPSKSKSSPFK